MTTTAGLDVDRLAEVLERMEIDCDPAADMIHSTCDHDQHAAQIAAEYARESEVRNDYFDARAPNYRQVAEALGEAWKRGDKRARQPIPPYDLATNLWEVFHEKATEPVTPDTRTTENPPPRYGDLIDEYGERAVNEIRERVLSQEQRVVVHHGDPDSYARAYNEGYADATRHEAEAAQGAAPRAEGLRTAAGRKLIALLAEYQSIADNDYPDEERRTAATEAYRDARETVKGLLPAIEAEADKWCCCDGPCYRRDWVAQKEGTE